MQPRQFENIQTAIQTFNRWELFYNNRRLHRSLGNTAPKQKWNQWLIKMNKDPLPMIYTKALSTKLANENHSTIEVKPILEDKIFSEQKLTTFENQWQQNLKSVQFIGERNDYK